MRLKNIHFQNILCLLLSVFLVSCPVLGNAQAMKMGDDRDQTIRVCLTRISGRERLDFTLACPYQLNSDSMSGLSFQAGSELTFEVKENQIYLYYQQMSLNLGKGATILRAAGADEYMSGLYLTNFPALYMGDISLDVTEGKLRAVLSIHVEDYLLGVIPHEMGDSFPLEALKAQAVAARTYALNRQKQDGAYDLVDNTNDQAFKGYLPGYPLSEQAVKETRGICGYYQGKLAQCFYSASNGGQTELVQNVWSDRTPYPYYAFGEDPYDIANPASTVRSFEIMKRYDGAEDVPETLKELVLTNIKGKETLELYENGDDVRIAAVENVSVNNPSSENSRHMTNLHLEIILSVRQPISSVDTSPEEVHLFENEFAGERVPSATYTDEEAYLYLQKKISADIPIFPDAERALSLSINSNYQNEIWSVQEQDDRFVIESRRYGHGVGMSQRGAQWMASELAMTYRDILSFYYPGMELIRFPEQPVKKLILNEMLLSTAGPAPTVTPRPTLMPVTLEPADGQWFAAVTEIAEDSSLNLRADPGLNSDILMRLYKGQRLLVLERCSEEGWVHVRTDNTEGYVMERYLTSETSTN